jgi:hypothetical protein
MIRKIALMGALVAAVAWGQTRPRDPFVFRTILRDNISETSACTAANGCMNRLVAVLLGTQMTALYSTERGSLFVTRNAVPQDGNLTYEHQNFGSRLRWPSSNGGAYLHRNVADQPWTLLQGGSPVTAKVVYKGFNLSGTGGNIVTLKHNLVAGATTVSILETPESVTVGANPGLQRTLAVTGLGAGQSLRLHLSGTVRPETWTVSGSGTLEGTDPVILNITSNGTTVVTGSWSL